MINYWDIYDEMNAYSEYSLINSIMTPGFLGVVLSSDPEI